MPRAPLVCKSCEAGVEEACARQAKGRRGASNGFAALQGLEEEEGNEEAARVRGDKGISLRKAADSKTQTHAAGQAQPSAGHNSYRDNK